MSLVGKRAVVTGATRGIGRAVAARLVTEGAEVLGMGSEPNAKIPDGCTYLAADFADSSALEHSLDEIARFAPDILVNGAGVNKIAAFADIKSNDFARIQQINVYAPFRLCQVVTPHMRAKRWGRIVNICSVWGKLGKELRASYSASKFALAGMTAALAAEVARDGVLANCISPGPIETEMTYKTLSPQMLDELVAAVPAGRLGRVEEVAALVAWLVGPENTFVAGQNIAIDGGMLRA
jgi:NAD(P)-dependent dehydrogenase (short-subunit alcohol dehydrogenase family)